jgi:Glycosyl transferases group 1
MVLTRAFARATPVVASDIDGYRELAAGGSALLVPPGDPDALAAELVRLLEDEPRRRQLATRARTLAEERYDWKLIAPRLAADYERLLDPRPSDDPTALDLDRNRGTVRPTPEPGRAAHAATRHASAISTPDPDRRMLAP